MDSGKWEVESGKISSALQIRLNELAGDGVIRVIVMVALGEGSGGRRLSGEARIEKMENARMRVEEGRGEIEGVLGMFNGRFLPQTAPSLGALTVELQAAGVPHLAQLESVKTILEDQPLFGFS